MTKIVYRTTYPSEKIYGGLDLTNSIDYFGSASDELVARDFLLTEIQSIMVMREIIWSSEEATDLEVRWTVRDFGAVLRSDAFAVGYNRWPRFRLSEVPSQPG